jgi:OOP family OmpA-OmpF porin
MTMSAGALAQQTMPGWYVGADVGSAEIGNDDDTAFRVLGGYQINRTFAAEVGYSRLLDKGGVEASAWELVGIASFPIANRWSAFGKLGLANVEVEAAGVSDDKTELTYGLGVQYDMSSKFGIRGQWQRYNTDNEVDMFSIGVIYRF